MFKRLAYVWLAIVMLLATTFINFDYLFSNYVKNFTFYKGQGGSLSKEVKAGFNFLGVLGQVANVNEEIAKEILQSLSAELLFIEEVDGTKNYYFFSNDIKYGVTLKSKRVNLHLSVDDDKLTLGSPLIFGSF